MPNQEDQEKPNPWAGPPRDDAENPPPPLSAMPSRARQVVPIQPENLSDSESEVTIGSQETGPGSLSQRLAKSPADEVDSFEHVGVLDTSRNQAKPEAAAHSSATDPVVGKSNPRVAEDSEWPDASLLLSNERTFLAWVRTSVTLMIAGVLLASFASEFEANLKQIVSVTLISLGMLCGVFGWLAWRRNLSAILRGRQAATARLLGLLALAILIVGGAIVAGVWLATQ